MAHVNLKEEYTLGWVANVFQSLNCGISPLVNIHSDLKSVLLIEELDIFYPLAECDIGPSGMRALPLAAGINVGGHYKWHFVSFFLSLQLIANSPRRGCRRNSNFCMGF